MPQRSTQHGARQQQLLGRLTNAGDASGHVSANPNSHTDTARLQHNTPTHLVPLVEDDVVPQNAPPLGGYRAQRVLLILMLINVCV